MSVSRAALSVAVLVAGVYAGLAGYWLSTNRSQNASERAYVISPDDENTRAEVARRCGGPVPAPPDACVREVEESVERLQRERADLKAQQEVAEWTFATALIALAALFLSAGGVWALVWTFREQRLLTINQTRAYLELIAAHYTAQRWASVDDGELEHQQIDVTLTLHNSGTTPALGVGLMLTLHCTPEYSGFGDAEDSYVIEGLVGTLPEIPARGTYVLRVTGHGNLPQYKIQHTNWRWQPPSVTARGKVTFRDVFDPTTRELELELSTTSIPESWSDPPVEFDGWHRARRGADDVVTPQRAMRDRDNPSPLPGKSEEGE